MHKQDVWQPSYAMDGRMDSSSLQFHNQIWQISRKSGSLLSYKPYHYTSDEAFQPPKVDPTFMSYICKIFDNLHMQWMGIWIHHCSIFTIRFGKLAEILGHCWSTAVPLHTWWGFTTTQSGSHTHVICIQGVWQSPYTIVGHMDSSSLCYWCKCMKWMYEVAWSGYQPQPWRCVKWTWIPKSGGSLAGVTV